MNFDYPHILNLFQEHCDPKRSESASFLIWYLENYYRLDPREAVDSVCDQRGDRGVDGIFVNENTQTIVIFQSRISQKNSTVGDVSLKEFAGTLNQFRDKQSIQRLIGSAGKAQVAALIDRLEIIKKITDYELRAEFLSNINLDTNGEAYLAHTPEISFIGRKVLEETYISGKRDDPNHGPMSFDISDFQITEYAVDTESKAFIAPVRASELIKLDGISNQSLFIHNVRGPLGKTKVNKAISESIRTPSLHKKFPLFHNGITIIAGEIEATKEKLTIKDYFVVNGCQSLTSLFLNKTKVTDNMHVLAKFIEVEPKSSLAMQITEFSNNQNGVKPRDFKANSSAQIRLKNEFKKSYSGVYQYEIKRGEELRDGILISNEDAGLYLMAFDLKEPWATHRKYQVFDDKHGALFGRPEVTADRIVLCQVLREEIDEVSKNIKNSLFGKYVLTRYLLMYITRNILEEDSAGKKAITNAEVFVRSEDKRKCFRECIRKILKDVVIDLNAEVDEYGDDFDYRGRLREEVWVTKLSRSVVTDHQKLVSRGRIPTFSEDWEQCIRTAPQNCESTRQDESRFRSVEHIRKLWISWRPSFGPVRIELGQDCQPANTPSTKNCSTSKRHLRRSVHCIPGRYEAG